MIVRGLYALAFILLLLVAAFAFRLSQSYDALENMPGLVSFGAAAGESDVELLAFVDYVSSYSQDVNSPLMQAVLEDGKTRVIFLPLPQGTPMSIRAAKLVLAAAAQGKSISMHEELMRSRRPLTDAVASEIAGRVGLDAVKLQEDMKSVELAEKLSAILQASRVLRVTVTPSVIGNHKVFLRPVQDPLLLADFVHLIKEARR